MVNNISAAGEGGAEGGLEGGGGAEDVADGPLSPVDAVGAEEVAAGAELDLVFGPFGLVVDEVLGVGCPGGGEAAADDSGFVVVGPDFVAGDGEGVAALFGW